jgi:pilus assembly protein CpaE
MRCIIISPSRDQRSDLEFALAAIPGMSIVNSVDHYPHQYELGRLFEAGQAGAQIIFIEMTDQVAERDTIVAAEKFCPGSVIVGVRHEVSQDFMLGAMRLGVREFLKSPITRDTVTPVVNRVAELMGARANVGQSDAQLFSFLPAKPGVGTTTIAVNCALAMAERLDGRTLLIDFDQSSGMIGFLLDVRSEYSLSNAVERVAALDDSLWQYIVAKYGKLHLLPTHASRPMNAPSVNELRRLIDFVLARYRATLVDLPGTLDPLSIEIMRTSTAVFLPCTPEVVSLRLTREKIAFLRQFELEDRIHILLNRADPKSAIGSKEIWTMLGRPVHMEFPNDYAAVSRAAQESGPVESMKPLFNSLAARALGEAEPVATAKQLDGLGKMLNSFASLLRPEKRVSS